MTHRPPLECLILPDLAALQVFLENHRHPTALAEALDHPTTYANLEEADGRIVPKMSALVDRFLVWSTTPQDSLFWMDILDIGRKAPVSEIKKLPRFKELQTRLSAYAPA